MRRLLGLFCVLAVVAASGCGAIQYTAGVCDCSPPPVASLLQAPQLPPHVCAQGAPGCAPGGPPAQPPAQPPAPPLAGPVSVSQK